MSEKKKQTRIGESLQTAAILLFCGLAVVLDFFDIPYSKDVYIKEKVSTIIQQISGAIAAILLMIRLDIKLFGVPKSWLCLLLGLAVAINNFPWVPYFKGEIDIVRTSGTEISLFSVLCLSVGLFEELIFRGVIFSVIAGYFSKDKKGLIKTFVVSSVVFGGIHIFNIAAGAGVGATILQVGYSTLTGCLFAYLLIKTKNIFIPAFFHALYNFCGLVYTQDGLGVTSFSAVADVWTFLLISVVIAIGALIILKSLVGYSEEDRIDLYTKLGVKPIEKKNIEE